MSVSAGAIVGAVFGILALSIAIFCVNRYRTVQVDVEKDSSSSPPPAAELETRTVGTPDASGTNPLHSIPTMNEGASASHSRQGSEQNKTLQLTSILPTSGSPGPVEPPPNIPFISRRVIPRPQSTASSQTSYSTGPMIPPGLTINTSTLPFPSSARRISLPGARSPDSTNKRNSAPSHRKSLSRDLIASNLRSGSSRIVGRHSVSNAESRSPDMYLDATENHASGP